MYHKICAYTYTIYTYVRIYIYIYKCISLVSIWCVTALVRHPQAAFGGRQISEPTSENTAQEEGERGVTFSFPGPWKGALKCRDGGDYQQSPNACKITDWLIVMVNSVVFIGYKPTTMRIWWWSGWWFGTFFFHILGIIIPTWLVVSNIFYVQ